MAALKVNPINLLKSFKTLQICSQNYSKTATGGYGLVQKIVTTSDNAVFVAYHPTKDFPYEYSRPLPQAPAPSSSLIKDTVIRNAMRAFGDKHPEVARKELMAVTHTCKNRWFPRPRNRRRKPAEVPHKYA